MQRNIKRRTIKRFPHFAPTLTNLSYFLSMIGAKANVIRIERKRSILRGKDVLGIVGLGPVNFKANKECSTNFMKLDVIENGEIPIALLNMVYPHSMLKNSALDYSQTLQENEAIFHLSNFVINLITKKSDKVPASSIGEIFAFICANNEKTWMLTKSVCCDVSETFHSQIYKTDGIGSDYCDFAVFFSNHAFRKVKGQLFVVVPDNKLIIHKELKFLMDLYFKDFGNYKNDESLTEEDWNEMTLLNSSISSAESFQLEIEGQEPTQNQNDENEKIIPNERYNLFKKIDEVKNQLKSEISRFEFSDIPEADINEVNDFISNFCLKNKSNAKKEENVPSDTSQANVSILAEQKTLFAANKFHNSPVTGKKKGFLTNNNEHNIRRKRSSFEVIKTNTKKSMKVKRSF